MGDSDLCVHSAECGIQKGILEETAVYVPFFLVYDLVDCHPAFAALGT